MFYMYLTSMHNNNNDNNNLKITPKMHMKHYYFHAQQMRPAKGHQWTHAAGPHSNSVAMTASLQTGHTLCGSPDRRKSLTTSLHRPP